MAEFTIAAPGIPVRIRVRDLALVRKGFSQIQVFRSTTTIDGVYAEITAPGTRPVLQDDVESYLFHDPLGLATYFYKIAYFNPDTEVQSPLSGGTPGETDPAFDIISVDEVKQIYLFGVDLTNDFGEPFPDIMFEHGIKQAVSYLEHELDIAIAPVTITDERQDFIRQDWDKFIFCSVNKTPVIELTEVSLVLPTEQKVIDFELEWVYLTKFTGQINVIPGIGQTLLGFADWVHFLRGRNKFLPDVIRISYRAGFEKGTVPATVKEVVGKLASFGPLNIAGDLVAGAGIASKSISLDGLSQSISTTSSATNAGYGSRLIQYQGELKRVIPMLRRYYAGLRSTVA
jgi:hypothetical protein